MTLNELKSTLKSQYKIDCWVSIENLEHSASSTLYKSLIPYQKTAYDNDYRFVFFNFSPIKQQTLEHVISIVNNIDISPYFVLVYSNQSSTIEFFQSHSINTINIDIDYNVISGGIEPIFNTTQSMCAYAWAGLHVYPNGGVAPCCDYNGTIANYNIRQHSITEIVHSDYMKDLRNQFRSGQRPVGCKKCFYLNDQHAESRMSLASYKLENFYDKIDWESDSSVIGYLGGHLGNLCNLKCRICSPDNSSVIAAEELSLIPPDQVKNHPTYKLLADNRWGKNSDDFWILLKQHIPDMCNFEFLGGEPLLLKENLNFLQFLIDNGHSENVIVELVTNGTQYPEIFDRAHKFKRFTVTVSVDNTGARFELERSGCTWDQLNKTVENFVNSSRQNSSLKIGVNVTVNIQNVLYLPEIIEWVNQSGIDHYYVNVLDQPKYLSIKNITSAAKELILNKLTNTKLAPADQQNLNVIIGEIMQAPTSDGKEFCRYMQEKDQLRKENFGKTHAEIAQAMGYLN